MPEQIIRLKSVFEVLAFSRLDPEDQKLFQAAGEVRRNAQAPYSHFWVGAALLSDCEIEYRGCNVERVSYTQGSHAEQNAIDSMVAQAGPGQINKIAIVGGREYEEIEFADPDLVERLAPDLDLRQVVFPCGHCRQIIWENSYADPEVEIMTLSSDGLVVRTNIGSLLPAPFGPEILGINYADYVSQR